ncbi:MULTISPECIES: methionine/alanine import family NSS transporter small subunit [Bacteria]|nr:MULTISPECIES: methionine/alanine import family NSS transporter small subunit [Priestia]MBK0294681.1 methionine/alanine import family NSS transporter small subunit [Bacillus sp. S34]AWD64745.1 MetS family NSS transporter small subunit [Priestia megaterium]MCA1052546.1 methionine/alanine import family NSS transporter small subunit [Priestia aryabhattai]MDC7766775.1 methionine/alanine import family NSS transporter small subunit [Priestia aryabhattai]MED3819896.1 methionine/alanine import famil
MDGSSITMMVVGMVIIWGGLAASIAHAVKKAKESKPLG